MVICMPRTNPWDDEGITIMEWLERHPEYNGFDITGEEDALGNVCVKATEGELIFEKKKEYRQKSDNAVNHRENQENTDAPF